MHKGTNQLVNLNENPVTLVDGVETDVLLADYDLSFASGFTFNILLKADAAIGADITVDITGIDNDILALFPSSVPKVFFSTTLPAADVEAADPPWFSFTSNDLPAGYLDKIRVHIYATASGASPEITGLTTLKILTLYGSNR